MASIFRENLLAGKVAVVTGIAGPLQRQSARGQQLDDLGQVLVLALAREDLVADDDQADVDAQVGAPGVRAAAAASASRSRSTAQSQAASAAAVHLKGRLGESFVSLLPRCLRTAGLKSAP